MARQLEKIFLYNRITKKIEEEKVFEQGLMDVFYGSQVGRFFTDVLFKKKYLTKIYGYIQRSRKSKRKISEFIKKYNIDMDEVEHPLSYYQDFNHFFIRKLKPNARPVFKDGEALIAPADSRLLVYQISHDTIIPVKGIHYTLTELVRDEKLTKPFINGICMVFRLAPTDYHRFCYIDDGFHESMVTIDGFYHSVSPISLSKNIPVFQENVRQYCMLNTKNFGEVLHIEVGALAVGKIVQTNMNGGSFTKGQEKGYFEFGGSTLILIFQPGVIVVDDDISEYSQKGIETLVKYGSKIGKTRNV